MLIFLYKSSQISRNTHSSFKAWIVRNCLLFISWWPTIRGEKILANLICHPSRERRRKVPILFNLSLPKSITVFLSIDQTLSEYKPNWSKSLFRHLFHFVCPSLLEPRKSCPSTFIFLSKFKADTQIGI